MAKAKTKLEPGDERHGKLTGYTYHGCRCGLCKAAWREYQDNYRKEHPEVNERKRKSAADKRRRLQEEGFTSSGTRPKRQIAHHRMRVASRHGNLNAEFLCMANTDAPCRLECVEGCLDPTIDHEHTLMIRTSCKIADALNAAEFKTIHLDNQVIYDGPIRPVTKEDGSLGFVLGLEPKEREESAS